MAAVGNYCFIIYFCDNNQWAGGANTCIHVIQGQYQQITTFMNTVGWQDVVALPGSVIGPPQAFVYLQRTKPDVSIDLRDH